MQKVCEVVSKLAEPVAAANGCSIWDVEFVREGGQQYLRLIIDKDGGVSIDDCEAVSRAMDPILDKEDPVPGSYIFEVSSAGAERSLKRPSDFEAYMGSLVCVKTFAPIDGSKEFIGHLASYANGDVTINMDGDERTFAKKDIAIVRLRVEF